MKRKVLVCGATGFIGRNITEHLAGDGAWEVTATHLKRPPYACPGVRWKQVDLRDPQAVEQVVQGMEVIIQAAATTSGVRDIVQRPSIHVTDNAVMNSLLFRAASDHGVQHVVFFSCTVMYPSSERPLKEEDFDANRPLQPNYFGAGWTKVYLEKMCEFYARQGTTKFTALRHSNIYGPHDKFDPERSHVFGATVTKVMTAGDGKVIVWGAGEEKRDLLYVDDLVAAVRLVLARQQDPFGLYNVGCGVALSIKDLVQAIIRQSGRVLQVDHDLTKPSIRTSLCLDCSKIREQFGWTPQVDLATGIQRTLTWYRQHQPH